MKRTPLKRKTPLKRSGWLRRKKRLNPYNRTRRQQRHIQAYGSDGYADFIRAQPCVVGNRDGKCKGEMQACHDKTKATGGGPGDLWPGCWYHHSEQGQLGIETFQKLHNLNLSEIRGELLREWSERDE